MPYDAFLARWLESQCSNANFRATRCLLGVPPAQGALSHPQEPCREHGPSSAPSLIPPDGSHHHRPQVHIVAEFPHPCGNEGLPASRGPPRRRAPTLDAACGMPRESAALGGSLRRRIRAYPTLIRQPPQGQSDTEEALVRWQNLTAHRKGSPLVAMKVGSSCRGRERVYTLSGLCKCGKLRVRARNPHQRLWRSLPQACKRSRYLYPLRVGCQYIRHFSIGGIAKNEPVS